MQPSLGRKRGLSGSEYRGPLPKKARDDDRGELISGVEIKCTQFFFMNNVSPILLVNPVSFRVVSLQHDLLDVITQEDVNAEVCDNSFIVINFCYEFVLYSFTMTFCWSIKSFIIDMNRKRYYR